MEQEHKRVTENAMAVSSVSTQGNKNINKFNIFLSALEFTSATQYAMSASRIQRKVGNGSVLMREWPNTRSPGFPCLTCYAYAKK